jgi:hypothetical protein
VKNVEEKLISSGIFGIKENSVRIVMMKKWRLLTMRKREEVKLSDWKKFYFFGLTYKNKNKCTHF